MGVPGNANPLLLRTVTAAATGISRSLRFNSADSAYLSRTPASAGNRRTWTFSCWVKRSKLGAFQSLFNCIASDASHYTQLIFETSDKFVLYDSLCSGVALTTTQVFRDTSAWFHFLLYYDTTQSSASAKVKLYVNGAEVTQFDTDSRSSLTSDSSVNRNAQHVISGRLPFTGGSSGYLDAYLTDIYFIDGQALDPTSFGETDATTGVWNPKAYTGSYGTNGFHLEFADNSAATATTLGKDTSGNGNNWTPNNFAVSANPIYSNFITAENCTIDTGYGAVTNGFDGNGSTLFRTTNAVNSTIVFAPVPSIAITSSLQFRGFIGANQGWSVKIGSTTLASGTNDPSENANWTVPGAAGYTLSTSTPLRLISNGGGEGVYWNSLTVDGVELINGAGAGNDSLVDVPTNGAQTDTGVGGEVRGNYCTWNSAASYSGSFLSNGNLDFANTSGTHRSAIGTIGVSSGKWYWEMSNVTEGNVGISSDASSTSDFVGATSVSWGFTYLGTRYNSGSGTSGYFTFSNTDVLGFALNLDAGTLTVYKNGVSQGTAVSSLTGSWFPATGRTGQSSSSANFGQRAFAYTAPSGFKALNTASLPSPSVTKPSTVMDVALYTGNGSTKTISGLGFSPDFVWIKDRSQANGHGLFDVIRGTTKGLFSNLTNAEVTDSNSLTAFNSDGFTSGSGGTTFSTNINGNSYVSWLWDAGSSTVTNTQGSITSSVRANATAGFSIVSYAGGQGSNFTVGHGLNVEPSFVITKARNTSNQWGVYYKNNGVNTNWMLLNSTAAQGANNATLAGGAYMVVSSSTLQIDSSAYANDGSSMIAYCFAPVVGYSSFGSYTGNGSTDGPFVFTGFRPRYVMIKSSSTGGESYNWIVRDTARSPVNAATAALFPNLSNGEIAGYDIDLLSNGFKLRSTQAEHNVNTVTYIYAAFAESPFNYSRAR